MTLRERTPVNRAFVRERQRDHADRVRMKEQDVVHHPGSHY